MKDLRFFAGLLTVAMAFYSLAGCGKQQSPDLPPKDNTTTSAPAITASNNQIILSNNLEKIQWPKGGEIVDGLQAVIKSNSLYRIGEGIKIRAQFKNVSNERMVFYFQACDICGFLKYSLTDDSGRRIYHVGSKHCRACNVWEGQKVEMGPGDVFIATVPIPHDRMFYLPYPPTDTFTLGEGTYHIKLHYRVLNVPSGEKHVWTGNLTSNTITIKVVK